MLKEEDNKLNKSSANFKKLEVVLEKIRPALERDGGSLELVNYDKKNGIVEVSFTGACAHCPISNITLKHLIETEIKSQMPEIKEIRAV